jgi:hypothetical protein
MRESVTLADIIGTVYAIIRPSGKNCPAGSLSERLYWNIWYTLYPIRKYLLKIYKYTSKQVNKKLSYKLQVTSYKLQDKTAQAVFNHKSTIDY